MGLRFQKRIKVAPGIRINLSKSGVSLTTGVRGASVTTGKQGVHLNTGIPGTGLSHRQKLGKSRGSTGTTLFGFAILALIGIIAWAVIG